MVDLASVTAEAKKRISEEKAREREVQIAQYKDPGWLRRLFRRGLRYDVARMTHLLERAATDGKSGVKFITPGLFGGPEEWKYDLLREHFEDRGLQVCRMLSRDPWNTKIEWLGGMAIWWGPSRNLPEDVAWRDYDF